MSSIGFPKLRNSLFGCSILEVIVFHLRFSWSHALAVSCGSNVCLGSVSPSWFPIGPISWVTYRIQSPTKWGRYLLFCKLPEFQNSVSVFGSEVRSDKYQVTYCILLWVLGHTSWASWAFLGILLGLPMGTSWASWTHFLGFLGLLGCASWSPEHTSKVSWVCLWLVLGLVWGTQFDGRLRISAHAHHCSVAWRHFFCNDAFGRCQWIKFLKQQRMSPAIRSRLRWTCKAMMAKVISEQTRQPFFCSFC